MIKLLFINIFVFFIGSLIFPKSFCSDENYKKSPKSNVIYKESQPSVITEEREFALFYTIYISPYSKIYDIKESVKIVANLQDYVKMVAPEKDFANEIIAGVGFGEQLYAKIRPEDKLRFTFIKRIGKLGIMPATGGDIFIHAKCNTYSKLFELAELISELLGKLPCSSIDVYSFQYRINRDISGQIDGTHNPKGEQKRREVAVIPETGGSYAITQRWVHDMRKLSTLKPSTIEAFIGRTLKDSTELSNKAPSAHIARVEGGTDLPEPVFEIVRQSMPYGVVNGEAGLFFIAYAAAIVNFDFMLDRMVGAKDGINDDLMRFTRAVTGQFWYFPGVEELKKLAY